MSTWPTGGDYVEALQNPQVNLWDPVLRSASPALNRLGLPLVTSGNFACVFKMNAGEKQYAVKCFTVRVADREARYRLLTDYLRYCRLPFLVDFEYQPNGVRIRGSYLPIVRMQWVEGQTLDEYVKRSLGSPHVLVHLANEFLEVAKSLRSHKVGHGDLQHGNILVVGDKIQLVDYDGMYVPGLSGRKSNELGHINYQHPGRTESLFCPEMDAFSIWVIYVSLLALAIEPALWQTLGAGDDCLLFRREDFVHPDTSPIFRALFALADKGFARLVQGLRTGLLSGLVTLPEAIRAKIPKPGLPTWVQDFVQPQPVPVQHVVRPQPGRRPAISASRWPERVLLFAFALVACIWIYLGYVGVFSPAQVGGTLGLSLTALVTILFFRYHFLPEVVHEFRLEAELRDLRPRTSELTSALETLRERSQKTALDERDELSRALQAHRREYIDRRLSTIRIDQAHIQGIGPALTARLAAAGVRTAADLGKPWYRYVDGIGPQRQLALEAWRQAVGSRLAPYAPVALPAEVSARIAAQHQERRGALRKELSSLQDELSTLERKTEATERNLRECATLSFRRYLCRILFFRD